MKTPEEREREMWAATGTTEFFIAEEQRWKRKQRRVKRRKKKYVEKCRLCGKPFVATLNAKAKWCSPTCSRKVQRSYRGMLDDDMPIKYKRCVVALRQFRQEVAKRSQERKLCQRNK